MVCYSGGEHYCNIFLQFGGFFSIHGKNLVKEIKKIKFLSFALGILLLLITVLFDGNNTSTGFLIYPFL